MRTNGWPRWVPRLVLAALAAGVAALLTLAPALEGGRRFQIELDMTADTGGRLQVFYDRGAGISESESAVVAFAPASDPRRLRLPLPPGRYRIFRIDPNDRPGRYVMTRAAVVDGDGRVVAEIPLEAIRPAAQAAVEAQAGGGIAITTPADADDPQLLYEPDSPILLLAARAELARAAMGAVSVAMLVLLAMAAADRMQWLHRGLARAGAWTVRHPTATVILAGLVGTLAATYPLLAGRSLVSPGNGPVNVLYDQPPFAFGTTDRTVEDARGTDVGAMMWAILPYTVVQRDALAAGELPLWNRYNSIGEPLWGQGQTFILDPFHVMSLAIPDPAVAMDLRFVSGRAVFATGAGLTVMAVTSQPLAASVIALTAPFVGHFTARFNHPAYFAIVYAPWILFAYARLARGQALGERLRAGALLAVATYLQLVGATPKEGLVALIGAHVAGALGVVFTAGGWRDRLGRLDAAALGSTVAVLLAAPHWLVFLGTLEHAYTYYDIPQVQFATLPHLVAYVLGGAAPGVPMTGVNPFMVVAAAGALSFPRQLLKSGPGVGAAAAVIALGSVAFGAVPSALLLRLPLIGNIHHIAITFLGATIAPLLVVAGVGLASVLDETGHGRPVRLGAAAMAAVIGVWWLLPSSTTAPGVVGALATVSAAAALMTLAFAVPSPAPSAIATVGVAAALAVFTGGLHLATGVSGLDALLIQPRLRADLEAVSPALRALPPRDHEPYRVAPVGDVFFAGTQSYWGIEGIGGPDALRLPAIESLSDAAGVERTPWNWRTILQPAQLTSVRPFLDMLNVRYLVVRPDDVPAGSDVLPAGAPDMVRVIERPTAWPRAFFSEGVSHHRGVTEFARRLATASAPFSSVDEQDSSTLAAVAGLPESGATTPATNYVLTPNTTSFRVKATGPGLAVLGEGYVDQGLQATLNGRRVPYFRVNHALRGVAVPGAGTWDVSFAFRPVYWVPAWALAALGAVGLIGMLLATPLLTLSAGRRNAG